MGGLLRVGSCSAAPSSFLESSDSASPSLVLDLPLVRLRECLVSMDDADLGALTTKRDRDVGCGTDSPNSAVPRVIDLFPMTPGWPKPYRFVTWNVVSLATSRESAVEHSDSISQESRTAVALLRRETPLPCTGGASVPVASAVDDDDDAPVTLPPCIP